jgi:sulfite reductase alpha subunit-like flavoprotein
MFWKRKSNHASDSLILYATKSGNAKHVAEQARRYFKRNGLKPGIANISGIKPEKLGEIENLLVVISTDGEGEPPPTAKRFFREINSAGMDDLPRLNYAVCALGDSSYPFFCEAGRRIDLRLRELNARPLYPRVECDADFSGPAADWIKGTYLKLSHSNSEALHESGENILIEQKSQYTGILKAQQLLSAPDDEKPCYHIEIETKEENFSYKPGDCIELKPENPLWLAEKIVSLTCFGLPETVKAGMGLKNRLHKELEITRISEKTLRKYHDKTQNQALKELLDQPVKLKRYLAYANVLDMVIDFRPCVIIYELVKILPLLSYRQYSIASYPRKDARGFDLLVKTVQYTNRDELHEGAASNYLCRTLKTGQSFCFRQYRSPDFHLPDNTKLPIIMIATGTGLAPFRAFLQQRAVNGIKGNTWLIFGERNTSSGSYFGDEFREFLDTSILEKMDTAFSREGHKPVHVQDIVFQKNFEVLHWILKGAHIYVCGSISMGKDVWKCFNDLLNKNPEHGITSVDDLTEHGRYHEDIY